MAEDSLPGVTVASTEEVPTTAAVSPSDRAAPENFLVVGSDDRECIDPNSPFAGAFLGDGTDVGSRFDTIMLIHVDPSGGQSAVLSFPRDLWVSIAGSNKKSRINAAFDPQNPQKLIDTIVLNFYVPVDHYVAVDFCAFKDIVDAIGGVAVPFAFATRDKNTGLNVEQPECRTMQGDEALAYVRSRHYQFFDPAKNNWVTDGTSDYGRITRQQDFLVRAIAKVFDRIQRNPLVAADLVEAVIRNVTTDNEVTVNSMIELATAMSDTDPAALRMFQIEGRGVKKGNASVIEPILDTPAMQQILALYRGGATPAEPPTSAASASASEVTPSEPSAELPIDDMMKGIFPPDDPTCR